MTFDIADNRQEIAERNALRLLAGLPSLSVTQELRRKYDAHRTAEFNEWSENNAELWQRIDAKYLARGQRLRQDPHWTPRAMFDGGMAFSSRNWKTMHWIWQRRNREQHLDASE